MHWVLAHFANYTLCLVANPQKSPKIHLNACNWYSTNFVTGFQIHLYLYKRVCGAQIRVNFTENYSFFANLVPNPEINTKTDLKAWNEHSVTCLISCQIRSSSLAWYNIKPLQHTKFMRWFYFWNVWSVFSSIISSADYHGAKEQVIWIEKRAFFHCTLAVTL